MIEQGLQKYLQSVASASIENDTDVPTEDVTPLPELGPSGFCENCVLFVKDVCIPVGDYRSETDGACILKRGKYNKSQVEPINWPATELLEMSQYWGQRDSFREKYGGS